MNEVVIRPFKSDDRFEVRLIAWETAFLGESGACFFNDEEILCDVLTLYFTDYEPESCFVAEYLGKVVGYLIGSVNEQRLRQIFLSHILLPLILKTIKRGTFFNHKNFIFAVRCLISSFIGEFDIPDVSDEYPAVLHINLKKKFREMGIGSRLINTFCEYLVNKNIRGVHLSTMSKEAGLFFKKNGFEMLHAATRTYMWHVQKRDVHVYIFGKKFISLPTDQPVQPRKSWFREKMLSLRRGIKNLFDKRKKVSYI
ncbi:MAG: GNAT family N-acetyltransferase [Candidatus Omnitrophota bacterium]